MLEGLFLIKIKQIKQNQNRKRIENPSVRGSFLYIIDKKKTSSLDRNRIESSSVRGSSIFLINKKENKWIKKS